MPGQEAVCRLSCYLWKEIDARMVGPAPHSEIPPAGWEFMSPASPIIQNATHACRRVPTHQRWAYAAPAFALAVVGIPIYVYIPKFYTDVVGVHIGVLGTLILLARLFDAVTDPAIGFLSDRTVSRFGRRRPYMAGGSLLLAAAIFFLFNPLDGGPTFETAWFGIWFFLVFLFWTLTAVPYEALGPELTFDYHERTTLFGIRDGALIAGTLLAAASPALVTAMLGLDSGPNGERLKFFWISVLYCPLVVVLSWWCVLAIRERTRAKEATGRVSFSGVRQLVANRPFVILLVSYTVAAFGSNLPATLILYYVTYVLESAKADLFLLLYFATGVLCLPAWVAAAKKSEKKTAWIAAMTVNTGAFAGVFFLGPGDEAAYAVLVVLSGVGFGATVAIPSSMQADVIDYDETLTGRRREGLYIGIWSVAKKMAAALGVGVGLWVLGASGYVPNVAQSDQVRLTLRILYALVPCACNVIAIGIALTYPIDRAAHRHLLESLDGRIPQEQGPAP